MKELGITKGETFVLRNQPVQRNGFYIETDSAYIGEVGGGYLALDQYKAIGELLIDGANTAQKCGLLPSELLRQRDELKEENKKLKKQLWSQNPYPDRPNPRDVNPYDSKAIKRTRRG